MLMATGVGSEPTSSPAIGKANHQFRRTLWHYRVFFVIVVLSLVIAPSITYYELGLNSANGTHPELVTASKTANNDEATFYVTIHVWSWAGSVDTLVYEPTFTVTVDDLPFGTRVGSSGTFSPNNFITYTFAFKTTDQTIAQEIANSNTNHISVQMSADVTAGWYHALLTKSDAHTWTFA